jgi:hypothetical protein
MFDATDDRGGEHEAVHYSQLFDTASELTRRDSEEPFPWFFACLWRGTLRVAGGGNLALGSLA